MNVTQKKERHLRPRWVDDIPLYLMALPGLLCLLIFSYLPMIGLVMAFQKLDLRKGIFTSPWVGLDNFKFLFYSTDAWVITRNTVCYNAVFIVLNMFLAVLLALLLSELISRKLAKTLQTIFIMPHFLSWPVVAIIAFAFLSANNGFLNKIVAFFGGPERTNWYMEVKPWPLILVVVTMWKGVGYSAIVYLAAISGISQEYYEAAMLDGASKFQQARYITIPHLRFIVGISIILSMAHIFRGDFGLFYNVPMNSGRIFPVTDVIDTYIYRALTYLSNVGMSTAAGLYQSVVGFFMVLIVNWIVTRLDPDSAMF